MAIVEVGIGTSVRVARSLRALSQARLAALTGLTHSTIFKIENGLVEPTPEEWEKIREVLRPSGEEWSSIWRVLTS